MCPPRGEPTRGLAPSVGARAGIASATSNTRPLRQTWREKHRFSMFGQGRASSTNEPYSSIAVKRCRLRDNGYVEGGI